MKIAMFFFASIDRKRKYGCQHTPPERNQITWIRKKGLLFEEGEFIEARGKKSEQLVRIR